MKEAERSKANLKLDRLTRLAAHSFGARRAWLVLEDGRHQFSSYRSSSAIQKEVMRHAPIVSESGKLMGSLWVIVSSGQWNEGQQELLEEFALMLAVPLEQFIKSELVSVSTSAPAVLRQNYPAVLAFERDGTLVYGNPAAVRLWNTSTSQIVGLKLSDLVLDTHHISMMQATEALNTPFGLRGLREGVPILLESLLSTLELSGKVYACVCVRELEGTESLSNSFILERRFREYMDTTHQAIIEWDRRGRVLSWNPSAARIFGYTESEVVGQELLELVALDSNRDLLRQKGKQSLQSGQGLSSTNANRTKSGRKIFCTWQTTPLHDMDGEVITLVSVVLETTVQVEAEEELRRARARDLALREALPDVVFTLSRGGRFLDYHEPEGTIFYLNSQDIVGHKLEEVSPLELARRYRSALETAFEQGIADFEHTVQIEGNQHDFESRVVRYDTEEAVVIVRDVTQRKRAEQNLAHMAFHDKLTDLPNRELFGRRFEDALEASRLSGRSLSVAFVDLNRFKQVNDSLGHAYGDALLEQVAARLRSTVRPGDTLARMGGDEFTLILPGLNGPQAAEMSRLVVEVLGQPFVLEGHTVQIGASLGISSFPEDGDTTQDLLRIADHRMYETKKNRVEARV